MAAKKPARKKDGNPSTVLIVFLVLFVLLSIGLGVWTYTGFAERDELKKKAASAGVEKKAADLAQDYYQFLARDFMLAQGYALDPDQMNFWQVGREKFMDDSGTFKDEKYRPEHKKYIDANTTDLGFGGNKYSSSYRDRVTKLSADLKKAQADLSTTQASLKTANATLNALQTKYDADWQKAMATIQQNSAAAVAASSKKSAETVGLIKRNQDLLDQIQAEDTKYNEIIAKLNREKGKLEDALKAAQKPTVVSATRNASDVHALVLDISTGKPLWDEPLGKIVKVDQDARQVLVNIGSARGVKPGLTFNVFTPGWQDRAEKELKATLEVIRVVDANSSMARITALYDIEGLEIPINAGTLGRAQREAANPIKEGDLVFNMFWGTHVVLAGNVNLSGILADSPAQQTRNLQEYMDLLERQGVTVDAWLDPNTAQLKGQITNKTRYLIRGDGLATEDQPANPMKTPEGQPAEPKAEEMPKAAAGDPAVGGREKLFNDAITAVAKDAVERGMFIISPKNFATVVGYRSPRSATDTSVSTFRPRQPSAGIPAAQEIPKKLDPGEPPAANP